MTTRIEAISGGIRVTGEMTVYTAGQIKEPLLEAIAEGSADVQLDLSGVSELDTAGVQLLLLIRRAALVSGRNLQLGAESAIVRDVLTLCGAIGLLTDGQTMQVRP
jgi:anti-sigma B factor antagonist